MSGIVTRSQLIQVDPMRIIRSERYYKVGSIKGNILNLFHSLQNRKKEWKKDEEERIANIPDPTIPAGHSLMPEKERVKTLTLLKKCKSFRFFLMITASHPVIS